MTIDTRGYSARELELLAERARLERRLRALEESIRQLRRTRTGGA